MTDLAGLARLAVGAARGGGASAQRVGKSGNLASRSSGYYDKKATILSNRESRQVGRGGFKEYVGRERKVGVSVRERNTLRQQQAFDSQKGNININDRSTFKEVNRQKKLGTFVPDSAYGNGYSRHSGAPGSIYRTSPDIQVGNGPTDVRAGRKQLQKEAAASRSMRPESEWKSSSRLDSYADNSALSVKERRQAVEQRSGARRAEQERKAKRSALASTDTRVTADQMAALNGVTPSGVLGSVGGTASKLFHSGRSHFSEEGTVKRAMIGTVQASAVSAAGHGGLAALQGEDPWEAAKTGAIRGAFVGAGYQGLKGATRSNADSIRGNLSSIGRTTAGVYSAHRPVGNAAARANPDKVSKNVRDVMMASSGKERNSKIFGLGGL